jgi:deoxyribose-phosphate aldolase
MENIKREISKITDNIDNWLNKEALIKYIGLIDLTSLNSADTSSKILGLVEKVNNFNTAFPKYPSVAAMCVYPNFTKLLKSNLKAKNVKIAVVAGAFPSSQSFKEVKIAECKMAVENGADEVDIVLALNKFLDKRYEETKSEIRDIKAVIGDKHLKVILETGVLKEEHLIDYAAEIAIESGADFIKTSTGKIEPAATPEAAYIMCQQIKRYYEKTGKRIGFKPAGGISTPKEAALYFAIVENVLGEEWLTPQLFRFGASRLANNLLTEVEDRIINYF